MGTLKLRGAYNAISVLSNEEKNKGRKIRKTFKGVNDSDSKN